MENPPLELQDFLNQLQKISTLLLISQKPHFYMKFLPKKKLKKWPFEVHFSGWKKPKKSWEKWYDKLVVNHGTKWLQAGILDGIHSSVHKIPYNKEIVLGVCEFWCSETNTFIFPWGEATITLEDVMVLGGFPVLGKSVNKEVEGELVRWVDGLKRAIREFHTSSSWMKHFMGVVDEEEQEEGEIRGNDEEKEGEFEHVAFLALWLSRFVFPGLAESVIKTFVFPIAAHLSTGTSISIAPIVLANLYSDMKLLVDNAVVNPNLDLKEVSVSGLFQIVQSWVFERFPVFAENLAKPLGCGDPRVARWNNVKVRFKLPFVRSVLKAGVGFRWRPYADGLVDSEILPFYKEKEQLLDDVKDLPCSDLPSFGWFCRSCELVGFSCKMWYNPHRVAMQFGFDQDHPEEMSVARPVFHQIGFPVPSRNFEPGMTRSYCNWWKESMSCHEELVSKALGVKRRKERDERLSVVQGDECHRPDPKNIGCSAFPWRMQVPPVVDAPTMFDLLPSAETETQLKKGPSSLEKGGVPVEPEIPKPVVIMSPGVSKSNSSGSHASVSPHCTFILRKSRSQIDCDSDDVSSNLDDVPLALRVSAKMATKKTHVHELTQQQASTALVIPPQIRNHGPQSSNKTAVISVAAEHEPPDPCDLDHVPLAVRLQTMVGIKKTAKPVESYASTGNVGIPHRRQLSTLTEELLSPTSDADSQNIRKRSSLSKTTTEKDKVLEVRVAKLEKAVAKLGTAQFGREFSVPD